MNRLVRFGDASGRGVPLALIALILATVVGALAGTVQPVDGQFARVDTTSPKAENQRLVFYKLTFTGAFDADALASGVTAPANAGFSRVVGGTHGSGQSLFSDGGTAEEALESFIEDGGDAAADTYHGSLSGLQDRFQIQRSGSGEGLDATGAVSVTRVEANANNSLLSVVAAVLPSPDWFVGLSGKELRPGGTWIVDETVEFYPRDLGTETGVEFDGGSGDSDPQSTISSLRNTGKFSDNPIATLRIELLPPPDDIINSANEHIGAVDDYTNNVVAEGLDASIKVTWVPVVDFYVDGYKVQWIADGMTLADFGSDRQAIVQGTSASEYTITGLTNDTTYWIRVVPYNAAGDGKASEVNLTSQFVLPSYRATPSAGNGVLVSNVNQDASRVTNLTLKNPTELKPDGTYEPGAAINQFTTGPQGGRLGSVTLARIGSATNQARIRVHLYSDDQGQLGSHLTEFVFSHHEDNRIVRRLRRHATFEASAGQIPTLEANTSYWLMFEFQKGTTGITVMKDDDEDVQSRPGWSIADDCYQWRGSPTNGDYVKCAFGAGFWVSLNEPTAMQNVPALEIEGGSAVEGQAIQFTVRLSEPSATEVTVQYSTVDGSESEGATTADSDYTAVSGATLTFAPNEQEKTFTIDTGDDSSDEEDETFSVELSMPSANAQLAPIKSASGLIINNDETTTTDATVSSITLVDEDGRTISLNETFDRYKREYTATANAEAQTIHGTVTFRAGVTPDSVMYLYGDATDADEDTSSTEYDADYEVRSGDTTLKFMVTSNDGTRTHIYKVDINKPPSTDSSLNALSLLDLDGTAMTLSPAFSSSVTSYTVAASPDDVEATLSATPGHAGATVAYPDYSDGGITVPLGSSAHPVIVTAEDGSTSTYTVTATRTLTVNFAAASYSVTEGGTVDVVLALEASNDVRVPLVVSSSTASSGDYTLPTPLQVAFGSSDQTRSITFTATDDTEDDDDETVTLGLGTLPAGLVAGTPSSTVITIVDNDDPPGVLVSFGQSSYTVSEGASVDITVKLAEAPGAGNMITVPLTASSTSASSADYTLPSPLAVSFSGAETSKTISFSASTDGTPDEGESVSIGLGTLPTGYSAGTPSTTTVNINDIDGGVKVNFGASSYSADENSTVTVTVTLASAPGAGNSVTIPLTTTNLGGAGSVDYSGVPSTLTFAASETSKTFAFSATKDSVPPGLETGEGVRIGLGALPTGYGAGTTSTTTVSIVDKTVTVRFPASEASVVEGSSMVVNLLLNAPAAYAVRGFTTFVNPIDGADAGDFRGVPGSVSFAAGDTGKQFTFTAVDDDVDDDGEAVLIRFNEPLPNGGAIMRPLNITITIVDNDVSELALDPTSLSMGEDETDTFTVKLGSRPSHNVTVTLESSDSGAATVSHSSLTFTRAAWDTAQTITVSSLDDNDDRNELVEISLTAASGDAKYDGFAVPLEVRIEDDDTIGLVAAPTSLEVNEGSTATFTVRLGTQPSSDVSVAVASGDTGVATVSDATLAFTTSNWNTVQTITVTAPQESMDDEDDETLAVSLAATSTDSDYQGLTGSVAVTVVDDEDPTVVVNFKTTGLPTNSDGVPVYRVNEGASVDVSIILDKDPERVVLIESIASLGQDDISNADYSLVWPETRPQARFTAGVTERTFKFTATQDTVNDEGEWVQFWLPVEDDFPARVKRGTAGTIGVEIVDDDDPMPTVSFGSAAYAAAEGGTVTVKITLSEDPERTVVIPLTTVAQGMVSSGDYSGIPASVTFNSGDTEKTFVFTATQDSIDDDDESVKLGFGTLPSGVTKGTPGESVVTINDDDDPAVSVSFGKAAYSVDEGSSVSVKVKLSADPERSVRVPIVADGEGSDTSAGSTDYSGVPMAVTFASGETEMTITFTATDDDVDDDGESVRLSFGTLPAGVSEGPTDETVINIGDNDVPRVTARFEHATYTVDESDDTETMDVAEHQVTINVMLDRDPERAISMTVSGLGQMGAMTSDFSFAPAILSFGAAERQKSFVFSATHDTVDDDDETVRLALVNLSDRVSTDPSDANSETVVSIRDDDDPAVKVQFGATTYSATEGGTVTVTVSLDKDPERTVVIPLTAAGQGMVSAGDYTGIPSTVSFNDGETSKTFSFSATDDTVDDDDESVKLTFGTLPAGVSAGTNTQTVIAIADNDDPQVEVSFAQASYTVAEGASITVTVRLSADPERSVTIPLTKTEQGAGSSDYSGVESGVTFASGETAKTFTVSALDDNLDDDDESIVLGFGTRPSGVSLASSNTGTTIHIADDPNDVPDVNVSFSSATYSVAESDNTSTPNTSEHQVVVTVMLSVAPERTLDIPLTTVLNQGLTSGDYSGVPAKVTFLAADTSQTFTFSAVDDAVDDDGESLTIGFGTLPSGVSAVSPATTTVSIADDEVPDVTVSFDSATHTLRQNGSITITVSLSEAPQRALTIPITTTNKNGATDSDYSGVPEQVAFTASESSQQFTVTGGSGSYDTESVELGFGTLPTGVTAGSTATATINLTDDDLVDVVASFAQATYSVAEGAAETVTVSLNRDPQRSVTIPLTVANKGGASDEDYSIAATSVTFASGATSATVSVSAADDLVDDDDESIEIGFGTLPTDVSAGSVNTATVSLVDNDYPVITVAFGAAAYSVDESDDTSTADEVENQVEISVQLSAAPEREITIPFNVTEHGAGSADYELPASITFAASETLKTVTLTATPDDLDDDGESVDIEFGDSMPERVTAGGVSETSVSIIDDDDPIVKVSFDVAEQTVAEGGAVTITAGLDVDPERSLTVPLIIAYEGGATNADHSANSIPVNLSFDSSNRTRTFTFMAIDDTEDDDEDVVKVTLDTSGDGRLSAGDHGAVVISITDDDLPQVSVMFGAATYSVIEGGDATVTVSLSADPERTVVIPLTDTPQGGATESDYTGVPANLTFLEDEDAKTFVVQGSDDEVDDDGESVLLAFGTLPGGVTAGTPSTTTVNIDDGDFPEVTAKIEASSTEMVEGSSEPVRVTVILNVAPERRVTIPLRYSYGGSGTSGDIQGTLPASVVFAEGDTSKQITLTAVDDELDDDDESITIGFGTLPTLVTAGTPKETTVSIVDDDDPEITVKFEKPTYTIPESSQENIKVVLSAYPERDVTITLTFTGGDGATAADYAIDPPSDLSFEPGQTMKVFTFKSTPDSEDDDGETVTIEIEDPTSDERLSLGTPSSTVVTIKPRPVTTGGGGGGGGGGGAPAPVEPSNVEFEWNVTRDIESLDTANDSPTGLWSDGETIWVLDNAASGSDRLYAYDLKSSERQADSEFSLHARNRFAHGVWSDGETVWVSDSGRDKLFVYDLETGQRQEGQEFDLHEDNGDPRGIWSDGETVYVLDSGEDALFAYELETGEYQARYALDSQNQNPRGIWSDGMTFWVSDDSFRRIFAYEIDEDELSRAEDVEFGFRPLTRSGNSNARGLWSDMNVLYVADTQDDRIYTYNMPDEMDASLTKLDLSGIDIGIFSSVRTRYTALLPNGAMQVTVTATTRHEQARVMILPPDADEIGDNGHQAHVGDQSEVKVMVTAPDGRHQREYSVYLMQCISGLNGYDELRVVPASYVGGTVNRLSECARELGVAAIYHLSGGAWTALFPDGPAFLSEPFRKRFQNGIPADERLFVKLDPARYSSHRGANTN